VGLSPLYCGHLWPIVPAPDDRWGWLWSNWWNEDWQGNRSTRRKPAPVPLCPPQIPLDQTRDRTRAAAVESQRLTAWAMARPCLLVSLRFVFVFTNSHYWTLYWVKFSQSLPTLSPWSVLILFAQLRVSPTWSLPLSFPIKIGQQFLCLHMCYTFHPSHPRFTLPKHTLRVKLLLRHVFPCVTSRVLGANILRCTLLPGTHSLLYVRMRGDASYSPIQNKLCGFSPQANYIDRATAACRRS
jgi:hypothetical protein